MFKDKQVKSLAGGADVTQYMKATRVSGIALVVLVAVAVLSIVAWMSIGTLKTTISVTGVNQNGKMTLYISPAESVALSAGQKVEVDGKTIGVITQTDASQTKEQVLAEYNDSTITQQLNLSNVNIVILADLDPKACSDGVLTVDVVTAEMAPLSIFKN